mmetsp:Transcript_17203/g.33160  ORF Transcript_17203/g.33160 Transcript_17203/m.33160 type:complete len:380 (+) Transcript_17203:3-1142(+)
MIRTLAFSAKAFAEDALQAHFLVLLSLRSDTALPSGVQDALEALETDGLFQLMRLPPVPPHMRPRTWGKLQLWTLLEYELVLYLDADTLIVGSLNELFLEAVTAGPRLAFAAALTRSMAGLNAGVFLLRPDAKMYEAMNTSLETRHLWAGRSRWSGQTWKGEHRQNVGVDLGAVAEGCPACSNSSSLSQINGAGFDSQPGSQRNVLDDQDHLNEFVATHLAYMGEINIPSIRKEAISGDTASTTGTAGKCTRSNVWLQPYLATLAVNSPPYVPDAESNMAIFGEYCTLPMAYNFCATSDCLQRLAASGTVQQAALHRQLKQEGGSSRLGARVLHWPGALRKPWQRCAPAARSQLDDAWWHYYAAACAVAPLGARCQLSC